MHFRRSYVNIILWNMLRSFYFKQTCVYNLLSIFLWFCVCVCVISGWPETEPVCSIYDPTSVCLSIVPGRPTQHHPLALRTWLNDKVSSNPPHVFLIQNSKGRKLETGASVTTQRCKKTFIPSVRATSPVCLQTGTKTWIYFLAEFSVNGQSYKNGGLTVGPL